ncbi:hypothetical protein [Kibdelosporangium philippinense]|uniref:hypothetical protein n=1 Tax=Kibdelosporangium philippinense TaxID=211113 RepID=UPI003622AF98
MIDHPKYMVTLRDARFQGPTEWFPQVRRDSTASRTKAHAKPIELERRTRHRNGGMTRGNGRRTVSGRHAAAPNAHGHSRHLTMANVGHTKPKWLPPSATVDTPCRNGGHTLQQWWTHSSGTVDTAFRNGGHGCRNGVWHRFASAPDSCLHAGTVPACKHWCCQPE